MDTIAIRNSLRKIAQSYEKRFKRKLFYRVCACDQLPNRLPYNRDAIIVINSDTSDLPGQHWYN